MRSFLLKKVTESVRANCYCLFNKAFSLFLCRGLSIFHRIGYFIFGHKINTLVKDISPLWMGFIPAYPDISRMLDTSNEIIAGNRLPSVTNSCSLVERVGGKGHLFTCRWGRNEAA